MHERKPDSRAGIEARAASARKAGGARSILQRILAANGRTPRPG